MEIKYGWERNECYMLVDAGGIDADHYQVRMLENNRISGLLKVKLRQINQQSEFCYTISGRQSMAQKYGNTSISIEEIKKLMAALNKTAGQLEEFLLNIDSLRLEPEWIYWKEEGEGLPEFCYYPEETPEKSFREHVRTLLQYLLKKISHQDPDAVNVAYGLYQIAIKETFRMHDLMQFLFYGTEENEEPGEGEYLSFGQREDAEWKTDDAYEADAYEMHGGGGRRKKQRQKQQQQQNRKRNQDPGEEAGQKQQWEQQRNQLKKQRLALGQRRLADYVLALLVAALAVAAVVRLVFLWYGRREVISEKEEIIHIGLICAIAVVSGIAIYKLMAKTDAAAGSVWESPEGTADWGQEQKLGQKQKSGQRQEFVRKQETFADECLAQGPVDRRGSTECSSNLFPWETITGSRNDPFNWEDMPGQGGFPEATCVLAGFSGLPSGGWRFRYQGTEGTIKDFSISIKEGKIMVGKKLEPPDIALNCPTVSRHHAVFQVENGCCTVRDCGSTNGTYLNGDRLSREETRVILPGSEIKFADVVFRIEETTRDEDATTVLAGL